MYIADTHCDTLYAMARQPDAPLMITPELLRQGGVTLQTMALWTGPKGENANELAEQEMAQIARLTAAGIRQVDDPSQAHEGECCFMLSIEGGELFQDDLASVQSWRDRGVRMAAISWNNSTCIAHSAKSRSTEGLSDYGVQVIREMQRVGMAVDVSHLNEAGFWDLFRKGHRPPMASHSCVRSLCDHFRNLTDEQLRAMIQYGGYVGVNFYPHFLSEDGKATVRTVAEHIDYICQMGGSEIVGFGSDFDGIEVCPQGLENAGMIPALLDELRNMGYSEDAVAGVAGGNLRDYFQRIG